MEFGSLIELLSKFGGDIFKGMSQTGAAGGGGAGMPQGADAAKNMPMATPGQQGQPQGQLSDQDKRFMQQQQMSKNGQENLQQMMQSGMSGVNNPGYKDVSQQNGMDSLMKMLMSMGGR